MPFAAGAARPLVRHVEFAPTIHGDSGIDGPVLPDPDLSLLDPRGAVQLIIDTVMASEPGEITLVPTGPLTNIALAARHRAADRAARARGGVHGRRRARRQLERDERVQHRRRSGGRAHRHRGEWPVTMVGLDVTHQAVATPAGPGADRRRRLRACRLRRASCWTSSVRTYLREQGFAAPPVHDPVAVAYVIDPAVLEVRTAPLDVELSGTLTLGMTVADLRAPAPEGCTTQVSLGIDDARFWDLVVDALERIG